MSVWQAGPPLVVGHRGGRGNGWPPENTIGAFERARREGARAVELDTRACLGGEVVVFHDGTLSRSTHGQDVRRVCDVPIEDMRAMGIPTLAEVLSWARSSGIAVNVEMKHDTVDRAALARATVRIVRAADADVLLSSFDPLLLAMTAWLDRAVPRALLVHAGQPFWAEALQRTARSPLVSFLHLERTQVHAARGRVSLSLDRYARRGLRLGVWTVNDPQEAIELVRLGVASIITDVPGAMVEALDAHSHWTRSTSIPTGAV